MSVTDSRSRKNIHESDNSKQVRNKEVIQENNLGKGVVQGLDLEGQNITTIVTPITTDKGGNEEVIRGQENPEMEKDFAERGVLKELSQKIVD